MHNANLKLMVAAGRRLELRLQIFGRAGRRRDPDELRPALADLGAGPIAPQDWFDATSTTFVKIVPPEKIVMGIANYGYDWPAKTRDHPHPVAQALTFQQGIVTAVESEADVTSIPTL